MADKVDQATATMIENLAAKTGRALDEWVALAEGGGLAKHREIIRWLQSEHGLTYGYANLIALEMIARRAQPAGGERDLVANQYAGEKQALRPIYEAIVAAVKAFGNDVEISPKKTYVSLRRNKQFAIVQPTTKTRLDVGINLEGVPPAGRLEASGSFNAMVSHRVRLDAAAAVDDELIAWLRQAYEAA
jgi:hypothetical protein